MKRKEVAKRTQQNVTKKQLVQSGLALLLTMSMFIGATFAWFTDSVTTGKNVIQAGSLELGVTYVSGNASGDLEDGTQLFYIENMKPGDTGSFTLVVSNKGTVDAKVKLDFDITNDTLASDLWFRVGDDTTKYSMTQLTSYDFENVLPVATEDGSSDVTYTIHYGMDENVQQTAANKAFEAYVTVTATQNNENATYAILKASDLATEVSNVKENGIVQIGKTTVAAPAALGTVNGTSFTGSGVNETTLNINANRISAEGVTLKDMTIVGQGASGTNGALMITGSNTTLSNVSFVGEAGKIGMSVTGANTVFDNVKVTNAFRGVQFWNLVGDNYITNSEIAVDGYTFNIDSAAQGAKLYIQNSTLRGWTSYTSGIELVSFENVTFGAGQKYHYARSFSKTTFKDCTFEEGFKFNAAGSDSYIVTFENCTYNGEKITGETFKNIQDTQGWNNNVTVLFR